MKKIVGKVTTLLFYFALVIATFFVSYAFILGGLEDEGSLSDVTTFKLCDGECPALSNGTVPTDGTIRAKRQKLDCFYHTALDGTLWQSYWVGPWTDMEGGPLPDGFTPPDTENGDYLKQAKLGKDGKPECPEFFNLEYGQRGAPDGWMAKH